MRPRGSRRGREPFADSNPEDTRNARIRQAGVRNSVDASLLGQEPTRPACPPDLTERTRVTPMPSCSRPLRLIAAPQSQADAVRGLLDLAADSAPDVAAHMRRTARLATALVQRLALGEPL